MFCQKHCRLLSVMPYVADKVLFSTRKILQGENNNNTQISIWPWFWPRKIFNLAIAIPNFFMFIGCQFEANILQSTICLSTFFEAAQQPNRQEPQQAKRIHGRIQIQLKLCSGQTFFFLWCGWGGGQHSKVVSTLVSKPSCPGFESQLRSFFRKTSYFDALIDSTLLRHWTVKSLIRLIEPIPG